jgi:biotin carboxyl carrier protein
MELHYQAGIENHIVTIERQGEHYHVTVNGKTYTVQVETVSNDKVAFTLHDESMKQDKLFEAHHARQGELRFVAFDANVFTLVQVSEAKPRRPAVAGENLLTAAMPGQVVNVLAKVGDEVKRGQTLVILEAMKMEIRVTAPADGRVDKVLVNNGQIVERGQQLIELASS